MSAAKGDDAPLFTILSALFLTMLVCAFLWFVFRHPILEGLRYLRLLEAYVILPFSSDDMDACRHWLHVARIDDKEPTKEIAKATIGCFGTRFLAELPTDLERFDYFGITGYSMTVVEQKIAAYYRWPWIICYSILAVYIAFFSKYSKFKVRHSLESFIKVQAKMWPIISPIVNFNPVKHSARIPGSKMPDKLPMFTEAMSPEEWVSWNRIPVVNDVPDRELVRRAFVSQLGSRWNGIDSMPIHYQALFAAFAMRGVQKRDESEALLGKLALCWSEKAGFVISPELRTEVRKLVRNPEIGGQALEIADKYAYSTTALLGVLKWARAMGGVLAPATFVWLRAEDRALWYPLNNLGRRSFHTEGAGALAHFMAEENAKKPLPIPRVDTAIITLNSYFAAATRVVPAREGDKPRART